jgi:hypothetical protein
MDILVPIIKIASYLLLVLGAWLILYALNGLRLTGRRSSQEQIGCVSVMVIAGVILIAIWLTLFLWVS